MIVIKKYKSSRGNIFIRQDKENGRMTLDCGKYGFRCNEARDINAILKEKYPDAVLQDVFEVKGEWE